jgi:hypothetical protein
VRKALAVLGLAVLAFIVTACVSWGFVILGADFWSAFRWLWVVICCSFAFVAAVGACGWLFDWCMNTIFNDSKPPCTPGNCHCKPTCIFITQDEVRRA